jgi:hypothetical protein
MKKRVGKKRAPCQRCRRNHHVSLYRCTFVQCWTTKHKQVGCHIHKMFSSSTSFPFQRERLLDPWIDCCINLDIIWNRIKENYPPLIFFHWIYVTLKLYAYHPLLYLPMHQNTHPIITDHVLTPQIAYQFANSCLDRFQDKAGTHPFNP